MQGLKSLVAKIKIWEGDSFVFKFQKRTVIIAPQERIMEFPF